MGIYSERVILNDEAILEIYKYLTLFIPFSFDSSSQKVLEFDTELQKMFRQTPKKTLKKIGRFAVTRRWRVVEPDAKAKMDGDLVKRREERTLKGGRKRDQGPESPNRPLTRLTVSPPKSLKLHFHESDSASQSM